MWSTVPKFLHDGWARNFLEEVILWNGGNAERSRRNFIQLPKANRAKIMSFFTPYRLIHVYETKILKGRQRRELIKQTPKGKISNSKNYKCRKLVNQIDMNILNLSIK
tara:strand:+ start:104 stop:427 length:324 start_codon:yes stop_codon:yes gene_type:complete